MTPGQNDAEISFASKLRYDPKTGDAIGATFKWRFTLAAGKVIDVTAQASYILKSERPVTAGDVHLIASISLEDFKAMLFERLALAGYMCPQLSYTFEDKEWMQRLADHINVHSTLGSLLKTLPDQLN